MTKIVYNACYGEFSLSEQALLRYNELSEDRKLNDAYSDVERTDPILVQVVEELGDRANGAHAKLRICEVPEGTKYIIDEYDGYEAVMTPADFDWKIA